MTTYVYRKGRFVEKSKAGPADAPYVISDTMDALQHMATGRFHESKAEFRKDTKRSGCVEYGNETSTLLKPRKPVPLDRGTRREVIRQALYEARNR